jgi:hypothetical protein
MATRPARPPRAPWGPRSSFRTLVQVRPPMLMTDDGGDRDRRDVERDGPGGLVDGGDRNRKVDHRRGGE